jgi:hypothetical protein
MSTKTNKIIAIVVVAVIIFGLAAGYAHWKFKEDARAFLADVDILADTDRYSELVPPS